MKILHVITKSDPLGGAQRYVLDLATAMKEREHDVHVAVGGHGPLVDRLKAADIPVHTIATMGRDISPFKDVESFVAVRNLIKELRPDVLQLNSAKASGMAALAAHFVRYPKTEGKHMRRPRIVFTAHGWAFNEDRPWWQRAIIRILSWVTIALSDITIAVSGAMTRPFKHWPLAASRMKVVYNGISEFEVLPRDTAREYFKKEGIDLSPFSFVVGMLSELHPIKGIDHAIRAISRLPDVALVVCGEGQERAKLEALARELNVSDRVFLAGYVTDARTRLKAFDAFLMSSNSEALGNAALEAGYAGVPAIVTNVGGLPEAIGNGGIIVPPRSPEAIAEAIETMRKNPAETAANAAHQRERVQNAFTQEIMTSETIALLSLSA